LVEIRAVPCDRLLAMLERLSSRRRAQSSIFELQVAALAYATATCARATQPNVWSSVSHQHGKPSRVVLVSLQQRMSDDRNPWVRGTRYEVRVMPQAGGTATPTVSLQAGKIQVVQRDSCETHVSSRSLLYDEVVCRKVLHLIDHQYPFLVHPTSRYIPWEGNYLDCPTLCLHQT
jgi:hypothetical protein